MFSGLRIGPHIGGKVRMAVSHTLIHDRHDDRRVAGSKFPRVHDIDICSSHGIPHRIPIAGIIITPLLRKHRVIERGICVLHRFRLNIRDIRARPARHDIAHTGIVLHALDLFL